MKLRTILAASLLSAVLAVAAACGGSGSNKTIDNANQIANNNPSASVAANATPTPAPSQVGEFGPPPVLGSNVTDVAPKWAASVPQSQTKTPNRGDPHGVCADIAYVPPADSLLWFRMAVDGQEVTQKLVAIQHLTSPTATTAETATICYAPEDGLSVGMHSAAVSVQQPNAPTASIIQNVAWKFEVTP